MSPCLFMHKELPSDNIEFVTVKENVLCRHLDDLRRDL